MTVALATDSYKAAEKLAATTGHSNVAEYLEALIEEAESLAAIREGLADLDAGRVRPLCAVFEEIATADGFALEQ